MHVVYITNKCMVDNLLPFVAAHQFINAVCILPYSVATSRKKQFSYSNHVLVISSFMPIVYMTNKCIVEKFLPFVKVGSSCCMRSEIEESSRLAAVWN